MALLRETGIRLLAALIVIVVSATSASAIFTTDLNIMTPQDLADELMGPGVATNVQFNGRPAVNWLDPDAVMAGVFSDAAFDFNNLIGFDTGVILSSGDIFNAELTPNEDTAISAQFFSEGVLGDPALTAVAGTETFDASVLEFDFVPTMNAVTFRIVFASDEYNEITNGDIYGDDVFGLFIDGINIAGVPGTTSPILISTINRTTNSGLFNDNDPDIPPFGLGTPTPFPTQYDGFTNAIELTAYVTPGVSTHFKFAVADGDDDLVDTAVLISSATFSNVVNQVSPAGTITTQLPVYTWEAFPGAISYRLRVMTGANVVTDLNLTPSAANCPTNTGTCTYTAPAALAEGAYSWFIQVEEQPATFGLWSRGMSFNVVLIPPAPVLGAPTGTIATTTPSYTWAAAAGATQYQFFVSNSGGVVRNEVFNATSICTAGTCTVTTTTPLSNNTTYFWNVRGSSPAGFGSWAGARSFTVTTATIPPAPVLGAPTGTIATTTPSYTWAAAAGATQYQFFVSNSGGVVRNEVFNATSICTAGTCTVTTTTPLATGLSHYWNVRGISPAGYGPWGGARTFIVQ